MSSSMFPNPDARAAQEAEGRGWQMENRVNRRFQEAARTFSCDTLETLLWHFGYSLVTSCIQQGHSQVSCYCIIHAIHTYWWLFWDFQVLTLQLQILVAIEWQVRFTNLPTEGIMNNVYIWWISILVPKIAFKKSNFCGNILHQQFPIFLCQ